MSRQVRFAYCRMSGGRRNLPPSAVGLTLEAGVWEAFQDLCQRLGLTPADCFSAWARFMVQPEAYQAVKEWMGKENEYGNIFGLRR